MVTNQFDPVPIVGNIASAGAIVSAWLGFLPTVLASVATLVALFYYSLSVYSNSHVQQWLHTRRERKIAYYMACVHNLRAQQKKHDPSIPDEN